MPGPRRPPPSPMPRYPVPGPNPFRGPGPIPTVPRQMFTRRGLMALARLGRFHPYLFVLWGMYDLYQWWMQGQDPAPGGYVMPDGWVRKCSVGGNYAYYALGIFDPNLPCDAGAVDVPVGESGATIEGVNHRWFSLGQNNDIGPVGRMGRNEQWVWAGETSRYTGPIPWQNPTPGRPPIPEPPPYLRPPPWRVIPGYKPPWRETGPSPGIPGPAPVPVSPPRPTRPPPGIRERKTRNAWTRAGLILIGVFHELTEIQDYVDSFVDAMDGTCDGARGLGGKIACIVDNPDKIDWEQAIINLVYNAIEDGIIGALHAALDRAGIGVGPNGQPYLKRGPGRREGIPIRR